MKKLGAIPIVFAVCLSSFALADEKKMEKSGKPMEAVIVKVENGKYLLTETIKPEDVK